MYKIDCMSEKTPINKQPKLKLPKLKLNSGTLESAKRRLKKTSAKKRSPFTRSPTIKKTGGRSRKVRRNRSNKKGGFQRRSSRSTKK